MKLIRILSLLACLLAGSAHAVTLVQQSVVVDDFWAAGVTSAPQTLPVAATAGNLIVLAVTIGDGSGAATFPGIDDAGTTVYACARTQQDATIGVSTGLCWGIAAGAGAGTGVVVTASTTSTSVDDLIAIMEFASVNPVQGTVANNGANTASVTSHDSGNVTPGATTNVLVAVTRGSSRDWTPDADFVNLLENARTTLGYRLQAADTVGSYTVLSDTAGFCSLNIAAFKGGGAPPSVVPVIFNLMQRMKK